MFRIFKHVRIEFDFHARDIESGDAIVCSEDVIPSPKFFDVIYKPFEDIIKNPEQFLIDLSRDRDHELTIYLTCKDFIYFLSLYLKSTLEVDSEYILETYYEVVSRLQEIDNTLLKPSKKFKDGVEKALNFPEESALEVINSAPIVCYLESCKNLPIEILLAHFFKTGALLGDLSEMLLELSHIHLITLHDAMVMGGFISDDFKPYADLEQYKRQEMCEPQDCRCASSKMVYRAKLGKELIWVVDYAKRENNLW